MKYVVMAILDTQLNEFTPPFFVPNRIVGIRSFEQLVKQSGSNYNLYPQHFALMCLGEYDTVFVPCQPLFKSLDTPEIVCAATDFVAHQTSMDLPVTPPPAGPCSGTPETALPFKSLRTHRSQSSATTPTPPSSLGGETSNE